MVPVVSLIALWGFATVTTAQSVDSLVRLKQVEATLLTPVATTVSALQAERTSAAQYLAAPDAAHAAVAATALAARIRGSDSAIAAMDRSILTRGGTTAGLPARIDALKAADNGLAALRARVSARSVGWQAAMDDYAADIQAAFGVDGVLATVQGAGGAADPRVLLELAQSGELLAREDAAVQSGLGAGRMSPAEFQEFTGAQYARQALGADAAPDLLPADRAAYLAVVDGPAAASLARMESGVRAAGTTAALPHEVAAAAWAQTAQTLEQQLAGVDAAAGAGATSMVDPWSAGVFNRNGAEVLLGLLAVLLSLLISVRIGRGLVVELVGLRDSALELAGRRLPAAMRRLRAGEELDIDAEAPVVEAGDDELGQVGEALNTVQRAALQAAVERAEVLSGVSGVFVNLARRSQVLVHRQLTLLDAMERRTEDPGVLEDLFRLDHLTTRMRRHAEGLIILSGAVPGRAWRKPVPLLDVVRSAVAEVEDYTRVEVRRLPFAAVSGAAVADLTHLVAEIVENATGFSPPHTKVVVSGEQVGTGYVLEVEDRGLGMSSEAVADANSRIADAQQAALFDSDRLGLFVVSRLARRHNIRVSLQPSPYGGTTAVLLLPNQLLDATTRAPRTEPMTGRRPAEPPRARRPEPTDPSGARRPEPTDPTRARRPAPTEPSLDAARSVSLLSKPQPQPQPEPQPQPQPEPAARPEPQPGLVEPDPPRPASPFRAPRTADTLPRRFPLREPPPTAPATANGSASRNGGGGHRPDPQAPFAPPAPPAAAPAPAVRPAPSPSAPSPESSDPAEGPDTPDGLPRRVRQASLNVQLREAPPSPGPRPRRGPEGFARDPESERARMSALQDGWSRGRRSDPAVSPAGLQPQRHLTIQSEKEAVDGRDDEPLR